MRTPGMARSPFVVYAELPRTPSARLLYFFPASGQLTSRPWTLGSGEVLRAGRGSAGQRLRACELPLQIRAR